MADENELEQGWKALAERRQARIDELEAEGKRRSLEMDRRTIKASEIDAN